MGAAIVDENYLPKNGHKEGELMSILRFIVLFTLLVPFFGCSFKKNEGKKFKKNQGLSQFRKNILKGIMKTKPYLRGELRRVDLKLKAVEFKLAKGKEELKKDQFIYLLREKNILKKEKEALSEKLRSFKK